MILLFVISAGPTETDVPRYKLRAESIILAKTSEEVLSALNLYLGTSAEI